MSYKPGNNSSLYLGYSKRINRPDMLQLNPTKLYSDAYSYTCGNALLNPSLMDHVEFKYQYKTLNVGLSYIHSSDGIGLLVNDHSDSQTEQTYSNCISTNSLVGNISYNYSHNRFNAGAQLFLSYNKSKTAEASLANSKLEGFNSFASCNVTYMLGRKSLVYASYLYYFPGQEQYIHIKSFQNLSIGFNYLMLKNKLVLNATVSDIFGTYYNRNRVVYDNFVFNNRIDNDNRYLNIKLTYKFGNNKVKRSNVDINSGNNRLPSAKR